jgi:hypothetical protein
MSNQFDQLLALMELNAALKARVKALCMIFDVEAKQDVALDLGLPIDAFYHLSFDEWIKIKRAYLASLDEQGDDCAAFSAHTGQDLSTVPRCRWRAEWKTWKENKQERLATHAQELTREQQN